VGCERDADAGRHPWNCYFQRVLSCQTPTKAQWHSILAGLLTIAFTMPPLLLGIAAFSYKWPTELLAQLQAQPAEALPLIFQHITPPLVALLGLGAIIGAVTSSFSASILSAGSMFAWNCCYRLLRPDLHPAQLTRLIRLAIVLLGAGALVLALKVQSVQALWFFTSDLGLRAAVSAVGLRALRPAGESHWFCRWLFVLSLGVALGRRRAAVWLAAIYPVSRTAGRCAARFGVELV
jgi:Na+/proline symporter